jgi:hypothetical protein
MFHSLLHQVFFEPGQETHPRRMSLACSLGDRTGRIRMLTIPVPALAGGDDREFETQLGAKRLIFVQTSK